MDNQDKLYQQFQNASQKDPESDFPRMEKIWGRVEEKLDKKALTQENNLWKKIAVAASILFVITLGIQFFKLEKDKIITQPETEIVTTKIISPEKIESDSEEATAIVVKKQNPLIKENADKIIKSEISKAQNYSIIDEVAPSIVHDSVFTDSNRKQHRESETRNSGYFKKRPAFEAVGVQKIEESSFTAKSVNSEQVAVQNQSPLFVINGKAITSINKNEDVTAFLKETDIDSIEILKEPLYIINGVEYSEEELFGPNPTSPYFPLIKQKIISTKILLSEEATPIYGEKGKKGVVIISTKNNKPVEKKD